MGYADGYPLGLSNQATVRVYPPNGDLPVPPGVHPPGGVDCPVLGRVNMDQITIDLTDMVKALTDPANDKPLADAQQLRTAEVELYSDDPDAPHALARLAALADSHAYELLCRLSPGLPRVYV